MIGLFEHLGSKVNTKGWRPDGQGLSDVLGRKLKIPLQSQAPKVVGQKPKCVLSEDILDAYIADADITLRKKHYGVSWSSDYRNNMCWRPLLFLINLELRLTRSSSSPKMDTVPQPTRSNVRSCLSSVGYTRAISKPKQWTGWIFTISPTWIRP